MRSGVKRVKVRVLPRSHHAEKALAEGKKKGDVVKNSFTV